MNGPTLDDVLDYAAHGWEILLLRGKIPAIPLRNGGHGVLDATTDAGWLADHWHPGHNLGARVPAGVIVIDTDPRHGGETNLAELAAGRPIPDSSPVSRAAKTADATAISCTPPAKSTPNGSPTESTSKPTPATSSSPPSLHPATGLPYRWVDPETPIAATPRWLAELLRAEEPKPQRPTALRVVRDGDSVADWFTAATTWEQVLWGWTEVRGGWRHPNATSPISATVRHDLLFVYSSNTPLEPTEPGDPHGYTRFRAWAVLQHGGNLSAAARAAKELRDRQQVSA